VCPETFARTSKAAICACFLSAPAPHAVFMRECYAIITQFSHAPAVRAAVQQRDELQREFTALNAAKANFKEIARVGTAHKAAVTTVSKQWPAEEDYLTLADRHAALLQKLTAVCKELVDAEDYETVTVIGAQLKELKALDASSLPSSRDNHTDTNNAKPAAPPRTHCCVPDCGLVEGECDVLVAQLANVTRTQKAIQHRDELHDALRALKVAMADFEAIGQAGKALKAANAELAQLPLSEEDYLKLADRHAALVQKVSTTCAELSDAGEFDALEALAAKLEELKALDVSALPQSWANDPVLAPAPPTTSAEEGEDDGANDPVYVPHHTDQITLA
jgi:formyltetrahydrofolate synthetase